MQIEQFQALPALEAAGDLCLLSEISERIDVESLDEGKRKRLAEVVFKMTFATLLHPTLPKLTDEDILTLILDKYVPVETTEAN